MVYSATGQYIHHTRLHQIVETESSIYLNAKQQAFVSEDQKHTFNCARVKYKKLRSRDVSAKAKEALATTGKTFTLSLPYQPIHRKLGIRAQLDDNQHQERRSRWHKKVATEKDFTF